MQPLVRVDGCILKENFCGQLIANVGMDANDCIFSIAFIAVEIKCIETWLWFVNLLKKHLCMENSYHWKWMSGKQKVCLSNSFMFPYLFANVYMFHNLVSLCFLQGLIAHLWSYSLGQSIVFS